MADNDYIFKENVKNAFRNVKEDINRLDNEIKGLNKELSIIKNDIYSLKEEISKIIPFLEKISLKQTLNIEESSTGNDGVFNKQTNNSTNKQTNTQQFNTFTEIQNNIKDQFKTLSKQEFLTFLTIYQLEEELEIVRYIDVAKRLKLSESSIRFYVTKLVEKKIPIAKSRINNKLVDLSLLPEFRKLGLKKELTSIYYHLDPVQKSLSDPF